MALMEDLIADLSVEFKSSPTFDIELLTVKVANAIRDVKLARCYGNTSMTEEKIEYDMQNYYSVCRNLALYDYLQTGASFETQHTENSVTHQWVSRDKILGNVPAFVKVL